jgi:hypothetical protein
LPRPYSSRRVSAARFVGTTTPQAPLLIVLPLRRARLPSGLGGGWARTLEAAAVLQVSADKQRAQDEHEQRAERMQGTRPLLRARRRELDRPADRHEQREAHAGSVTTGSSGMLPPSGLPP